MDESDAKERLLETENLTDTLEDDDANWLLDWGTGKVAAMIAGITDDDAAGDRVDQLMKVMRSLNQISGDLGAVSPSDLADEVHTFVERYNAAFGTSAAPSDDAITALATKIATLKPREAMQVLLASVAPATPTSSTGATASTALAAGKANETKPVAAPTAAATPASAPPTAGSRQHVPPAQAATSAPQSPPRASATTGSPVGPPAVPASPETPDAQASKAPPPDKQQKPTSAPPGQEQPDASAERRNSPGSR